MAKRRKKGLFALMKQNKVWVPLLVGCLAVGGVIAVFPSLMTIAPSGEVSETSQEFAFEEDQMRASAAPGVTLGIEIPGYKQIVVSSDSITQSVELPNPERNNVYFRITMVLTETGEEIYQSDLLAPGQTLYQIDFHRKIEIGEYPLTLRYETFTNDGDFTPQNGATMESVLLSV